ncbi:battenin-like [Actinia tenebrosa]|uniref:Battenin n=1 Tax=Actinia tenebrosa TaxID=6105 RepID=A0A6P8H3L8_ACTTE|nr:battenin-like [Actinia tenebrosa]
MASNKAEFEDEDGDEKGSKNSLLSHEGEDYSPDTKYKRSRNLVGFWILGLCNNFSYVVMLSAAHDILNPRNTTASAHQNSNASSLFSNGSANGSSSVVDGLECNPLSTGTVLLADILPTVFVKVTAPFYMKKISYNIRAFVCILFAFASFFMIAYSHVLWISLLGVVCASLSSGLGEITILSFSAHFDKDVVSTWSSGTGAAGLFGALSYAGLISAGMSPRNTVLVMNIVPFLFGLSFWFILEYPSYMRYNGNCQTLYFPIETSSNRGDEDTTKYMSLYEKLVITKSLLKYMIPLFLVYFAEYFINQGLQELIYWKGIWLTPAEQYRWYQVDYQFGVLISRSSVNLFPIKNTCLLAFLQYVNLVVLFFEAYFHYMPSVWIMFAIILFEGLLGGAVYVNSFYRISKEVAPEHREFSMGVASMADSFGIALAGASALPTHNALCSYWRKKQR